MQCKVYIETQVSRYIIYNLNYYSIICEIVSTSVEWLSSERNVKLNIYFRLDYVNL